MALWQSNFALPFLLVLAGRSALAQQNQTGVAGRGVLQEIRAKQLEESSSYLSSAPIHHVIPEPNQINVAVEATGYFYTIGPSDVDISADIPDGLNEYLEVNGTSIAPYFAFSIKNFGIGFRADYGNRKIHYARLTHSRNIDGIDTSFDFEEHYSELKYSGVGGFFFANVNIKSLPKFIKPTAIVGVNSIAVEHQSFGRRLDQFVDPENLDKYRYTVRQLHVGANVGIHLLKRFTLRPWFDVLSVDVSTAKSSEQDGDNAAVLSTSGTATDKDVVILDQELVWSSTPQQRFGIDFSINFGSIDIAFGGMLGALGNIAKGNNRVYDSTLSASVTYSIGGR